MKKLFVAVAVTLLVLVISIVSFLVVLYNNEGTTVNTSPTPINEVSNTPTLNATNPSTPTQYTYAVIQSYPHNTSAFTEGLVYQNGSLFESTGLYGMSTLRRVDLITGNVLQEIHLGDQYFGEGIAIVNDTIIQLTWQEHVGFVYDKSTFQLLRNFTYPTEGWGLTYNGSSLIMSDGSDNLYFLDPSTFQIVGQVKVHEGSNSVQNINELEYVNGEVYANIFLQEKIAVIDPQTGVVKAWIDLSGIQNTSGFNSEMVLNGIAYDNQNNRLFVTGKDWPSLFEIKLVTQK